MKPKNENTTADGSKGLDSYDGVQRLSLPAGQVLIYRGNKAPGVFIFLSGCVRSGSRIWRSNGIHQPFLIPDASGLDSPFPENVTIEKDATALFLYRSVVLREISVRQLLEFIGSGWLSPELEQGGATPVAIDACRDPLPIRKRTTFRGNGDVSVKRTVHCWRQGGSVAIADCLLCDHCERFVWGDDGEPSELICDYDGMLTKDLFGAAGLPFETSPADRIPVSTIMTSDVICVKPDLSVETLTTLFLERGFSGAPVVDASGNPIGMVSKTDLVRDRADEGSLEEEEPLWAHGDRGIKYPLGSEFHAVSIARATVADIMMPIVFAVPENTTVAKAAALMAFEGVHRVPVVSSSGQVVGILSSLDILRLLAEHAGWLIGRTESVKPSRSGERGTTCDD